jgi:hypothetical protein
VTQSNDNKTATDLAFRAKGKELNSCYSTRLHGLKISAEALIGSTQHGWSLEEPHKAKITSLVKDLSCGKVHLWFSPGLDPQNPEGSDEQEANQIELENNTFGNLDPQVYNQLMVELFSLSD